MRDLESDGLKSDKAPRVHGDAAEPSTARTRGLNEAIEVNATGAIRVTP